MRPILRLLLGVALVTCLQFISADAASSPRWLCGHDYPYAKCTPKNNCGTTPEFPMVCVDADHIVDPTEAACSDVPKPDVTDSSGCGTWMCSRFHDNSYVPCDHPSVCTDRCSETEIEITEDVKKSIGRACIVNGRYADKSLCPEGLVPPPVFQSKCLPTGDCRLLCTEPGTNIVGNCQTGNVYESCPTDRCGVFIHHASSVCSATNVFPGREATPINSDMCKYHYNSRSSKTCEGDACDNVEYRFVCRPKSSRDETSYVVCPTDDEADGFSTFTPCSEQCNAGTRSRDVRCAAFKAGSDVPSGFVQTSMCTSEGPVMSIGCEGPPCPAVWSCITPGTSSWVSKPCHVEERAAYLCGSSVCGINVAQRAVTCRSGFDVVDAALCSDFPMPPTVTDCPPIGSNCSTEAKSVPCNLASDGSIDPSFPQGGPSCITPGQPQPFRKSKCFDGQIFVDDVNCAVGNVDLIEECSLPDCTDSTPEYQWQTVTGPCQLKGTHCMSYRVDTVYCAAVGSLDVAVSDSHCNADEKPQAVQPCPATEGARFSSPFKMNGCNTMWNNTCVAEGPAVVDGIEYPDIQIGRCDCAGVVGDRRAPPFCEFDADAPIVAMHYDEETEEIVLTFKMSTYYITYATIFARKDFSTYIPIGTVPSTAVPEHRVPAAKLLGFPPGNATVGVNIIRPFAGGSDVVIPPICSLRSVQCKVGECNNSTGVCDCPPGYSGHLCEFSVCDNFCTEYGADSCTVTELGQPACECKSDAGKPLYTGHKCEVPQKCIDAGCKNGGVPTGEEDENGVAVCSCNCVGTFGGDKCEACKITNSICTNGGTVKSDCSGCSCKEGFVGPLCSCRSLRLRYVVNGENYEWYGSPDAHGSFLLDWLMLQQSSIRSQWIDMSGTWAKIRTHQLVMDKNVKRYIVVTADVGYDSCSADDDAIAELGSPFATASAFTTTDVPKVYDLVSRIKTVAMTRGPVNFMPEFGVGITDLNCEQGGSECPTDLGDGGAAPSGSTPVTPTEDTSSGSSGLSTSDKIIIGVCVGVGVPLLALFVFLMYRFLSSPSASSSTSTNDVELGGKSVA